MSEGLRSERVTRTEREGRSDCLARLVDDDDVDVENECRRSLHFPVPCTLTRTLSPSLALTLSSGAGPRSLPSSLSHSSRLCPSEPRHPSHSRSVRIDFSGEGPAYLSQLLWSQVRMSCCVVKACVTFAGVREGLSLSPFRFVRSSLVISSARTFDSFPRLVVVEQKSADTSCSRVCVSVLAYVTDVGF